MTMQPIYGDNGEVVDHYDDGVPEEAAPAWTVPDQLKVSDLFIGTTIHQDDGHPQGPLVSVFARNLADAAVTVKTYRAAELSQHSFLDNLQKGIALALQAYFLSQTEKQPKKQEEKEKRQASSPTPPPQAPKMPPVRASASPKPASKETKSRYSTLSLFD